jgi:hypothetical protein
MNRYTLLVKQQRKLLGSMRATFKAKSKALKYGWIDQIPGMDERYELARLSYIEVTDKLAEESAIMVAKGLNPYDYAPEAEYIPNDDEE